MYCLPTGLLAASLSTVGLVCLIRGMNSLRGILPPRSTRVLIREFRPASATRTHLLPSRLRFFCVTPAAVWLWMQLLYGASDFALAQSSSVCVSGSVFNTSLTQCVTCPGGMFCLGGANPTISCPAGMLSCVPPTFTFLCV